MSARRCSQAYKTRVASTPRRATSTSSQPGHLRWSREITEPDYRRPPVTSDDHEQSEDLLAKAASVVVRTNTVGSPHRPNRALCATGRQQPRPVSGSSTGRGSANRYRDSVRVPVAPVRQRVLGQVRHADHLAQHTQFTNGSPTCVADYGSYGSNAGAARRLAAVRPAGRGTSTALGRKGPVSRVRDTGRDADAFESTGWNSSAGEAHSLAAIRSLKGTSHRRERVGRGVSAPLRVWMVEPSHKGAPCSVLGLTPSCHRAGLPWLSSPAWP